MIFSAALRALAAGKKVKRPGETVLVIQQNTIPILTTGLLASVGGIQEIGKEACGNWFLCKFPVIVSSEGWAPGTPYAFTDEEVAANNWEVVP